MKNHLILFSFLLLSFNWVFSQNYYTLGGDTSATTGQSKNYSVYGDVANIIYTNWSVSGVNGTVGSNSNTSGSITFNAAGTAFVNATVLDDFYNNHYLTRQVTVTGTPPPTPNNPVVASTVCNQATLNRSGTLPSGVTWFWQGKSSNGQSTLKGSGSAFTATEGSGTYYIRAQDNVSKLWSDNSGSRYVTISNPPNSPTVSGKTICSGTNTFLTASGISNATYRWYDNSDNFLYEGAIYGTLNLNSTTIFKVSATINGCEGSKSSVTVTVTSSPNTYLVSGPSGLCSGSSGKIYLAGSQTGVNYQLFKNNVSLGTDKPGSGAALEWNGMTPGTYKVEASNANGQCSAVTMLNEVTVATLTPGNISISTSQNPTNICPGTQITLVAQGGNPVWTNTSTGATYSGTAYTFTPVEGNTIFSLAADEPNCQTRLNQSITITVLPSIGNVSIDSGITSRCIGNGTSTYTASASNASTYSWQISPTAAGTINSSSGIVVWDNAFSGTATISVNATDNCGNSNQTSINVDVSPLPNTYLVSGPSSICSGSTVEINLAGSQIGVNYQLFKDNAPLGATEPGSGSSILWTGMTSGTYKVEASNSQCSPVEMLNEVTVAAISPGTISINTSVNPTNVCPGTQVTLVAQGGNPVWTNTTTGATFSGTAYTFTPSQGNTTFSLAADEPICQTRLTQSITLTLLDNIGNVSIDSGITSRCMGTGTSVYTASASNATAYTWALSPISAGTINIATGTVEWNDTFSDLATVSVTATNACESSNTETMVIDVSDQISFYLDEDRDGFYLSETIACDNPNPTLYVTIDQILGSGDCDDIDSAINPNTLWYLDADEDNHAVSTLQSCTNPGAGYTLTELPTDDCDDADSSALFLRTWHLDNDGDGYSISSIQSCGFPGAGYVRIVAGTNDCDDTDANIRFTKWYEDNDLDGLGDPTSVAIQQCDAPIGNYAPNNDDFCPNTYDPDNYCGSGGGVTGNGGNFDMNFTGHNYVYTRAYQKSAQEMLDAGVNQNNISFFTASEDIIQQVTYFDGLGRPIQQLGIDQTPLDSNGNSSDIVTHIGYDDFGRQEKDWLPIPEAAGALGAFRTIDLEQATKQYYNTNYASDFLNTTLADVNPYSQKEFDDSPLNRVLKQAAPGKDWALGAGHEIAFDYLSNVTDEVRLFKVTTVYDLIEKVYTPTLMLDTSSPQTEFYGANELYITIIKDENHDGTSSKLHTSEAFKNKQGQVVLKRTYALVGSPGVVEPHDTYYIYDGFNNLTYVLPPLMQGSTATFTSILNNMDALGYQYTYDQRNRLVEKQIPSKEVAYIVYNELGQPIMTQDANHRLDEEWLFTKYDAFGRVAYTGKATANSGTSRKDIQEDVDNMPGNAWVSKSGTANTFGGTSLNYNNGAYPHNDGNFNPNATITEVLTINYYDDYDFDRSGAGTTVISFGVGSAGNLKGLATGSIVKVLDVTGTDVWITTVNYYDDKGRPIYNFVDNAYLGTVDIINSRLDFSGKPLQLRSSHERNGTTIVTLDNFTYDHTGRVLSQTQCIGDASLGENCSGGTVLPNPEFIDVVSSTRVDEGTLSVTLKQGFHAIATSSLEYTARIVSNNAGELIVANTFNQLGQLQSKDVGGAVNGNGLQTVDYAYNIRGWLKSINDDDLTDDVLSLNAADLWGFKIKHNDIANVANKLYNGNISQTLWESKSVNPLDIGGNPINPASTTYTYTYDALNRIKTAMDDTNNYNVTGINYDQNGNILSLTRAGLTAGNTTFGVMDSLSYAYIGNQLNRVNDASGVDEGFKDGSNTTEEYGYDDNGNMTFDQNKGITNITYNHLNLPDRVDIDDENIQFVYSADGMKLKKIVSSTGAETIYSNGYIYQGNTLQFFQHPEGYVSVGNGDYAYVYNYVDHLGNIRLNYTDANGDGDVTQNEIVQENIFYPFGMRHKGYNNNISSLGNSTAKKFQYNGQELNESLGLNIVEMDFRQYDAALGRFNVMDRLSELAPSISPYRFAYNNPIYWSDPTGLMEEKVGADGLTNSQWISASNPNANRNLSGQYIQQNRRAEIEENKKFKFPDGVVDYNAPGAEGTNEVFRIYSDDATHVFYINFFAMLGDSANEVLDQLLDVASDVTNAGLGVAAGGVSIKGGVFRSNGIYHRFKSGKYMNRWTKTASGGSKWNNLHRHKYLDKVKGLRGIGTKLGVASFVFIGADIAVTGQIKTSHGINALMTGLAFTGAGAPVAAIWFIADFGTMGVNYLLGNGAKGLGDMIDEYTGPLYDFNE